MAKAGWVFRVEVVTDKPSVMTEEMIRRLIRGIKDIPDVSDVLVNELYEDIKLFHKEDKKGEGEQ